MINIQEIEKQSLDYLYELDIEERYSFNLVMSDKIYETLSREDKRYLFNFLQTECKGHLVHNSFVPDDFIAIVNMKLSVTNPNKLFKFDKECFIV